MEWQPIESAPRDGSICILWSDMWGPFFAYFENGDWHSTDDFDPEKTVNEVDDFVLWAAYERPDDATLAAASLRARIEKEG